ncbi:MAG: hypothetical protein WCO44_13775 [Bacteroidota bacterium]
MNRSFCVALISLILLQTGGLYLVFQAEQVFVQYETVAALRNRDAGMVTRTIPAAEFKQSAEGTREIVLHGKLYDIKSATVKGGMVVLHLFKDDREMNIMHRAGIAARCDGSGNHGIPVKLVKLMIADYLFPGKCDGTSLPCEHPEWKTGRPEHIRSHNGTITTPPPEEA